MFDMGGSIDAGRIDRAIRVPRRALRDNGRVWVVDADERLQVRAAEVVWESGQRLLLQADSLQAGDRVVVSRVSGLAMVNVPWSHTPMIPTPRRDRRAASARVRPTRGVPAVRASAISSPAKLPMT